MIFEFLNTEFIISIASKLSHSDRHLYTNGAYKPAYTRECRLSVKRIKRFRHFDGCLIDKVCQAFTVVLDDSMSGCDFPDITRFNNFYYKPPGKSIRLIVVGLHPLMPFDDFPDNLYDQIQISNMVTTLPQVKKLMSICKGIEFIRSTLQFSDSNSI